MDFPTLAELKSEVIVPAGEMSEDLIVGYILNLLRLGAPAVRVLKDRASQAFWKKVLGRLDLATDDNFSYGVNRGVLVVTSRNDYSDSRFTMYLLEKNSEEA